MVLPRQLPEWYSQRMYPSLLSDPNALAARGEQIYNDRYRAEFELVHRGKYVAIDVSTEQAYLGATPEEAVEIARRATPRAILHLVKVGDIGAFRSTRVTDAEFGRVFR